MGFETIGDFDMFQNGYMFNFKKTGAVVTVFSRKNRGQKKSPKTHSFKEKKQKKAQNVSCSNFNNFLSFFG